MRHSSHSCQRKLHYLLVLALQQCGELSPGASSKRFILSFLLELSGNFTSILFVKRDIFFPCMKWSRNVALTIRCLWESWILSFWGMHRVWIRLSHVTKRCISKGLYSILGYGASYVLQWLISFKDSNYLWGSIRQHEPLIFVLQKYIPNIFQ